jgi:hypothetical protein
MRGEEAMTRTRTICALLFIVMASLFIANTGLAQDTSQPKITASSIQILLIDSKEVTLPAEFQVALYENLVAQVQKTGKFQHVYRDGDRNATDAPDMVVLHSTVHGFKKGSERERQVTTVAGATSINIHCQITDKTGKSLLERDVTGKVRFLGGNLRATYDFAKKVAEIVRQSS